MHKLKSKKVILLLLTAVLIFNGVFVFADSDIKGLEEKKKNATKEMKDIDEGIKDLRSQSDDVSAEIEELDKEIIESANEINKVESELSELNTDIEKTVKELEEAQKNLKDKQGTFNKRLRTMYMNGNVGFLEVLLASCDLGDFLTRQDMIQSIVDSDVELLKYMQEQRDIIDKKSIELKAQKASVEVAKSNLENKKNDLEVASRSKSIFMEDLNKDLKKAEAEYDKLNKLAKSIESEIVKKQSTGTTYVGTNNNSSNNNSSNNNSSSNNSSNNNSSNDNNSNSGSTSGGTMAWPVPSSGRISSYYGNRTHPIYGTNRLHTGIDISASSGSSVVAAQAGTVIHSGWLGSYGNTIMIDHGGGIVTLYAHNSSLNVGVGASVSKGSTIASIGSTGASTGPHLHFEVRQNGRYINPLPWVQ